MLNKILHLIHHFDDKLHHSLYYSLLGEDTNEIDIDDAVHQKKCHHKVGRWNFKLADKDYSCGVYRILEAIRQRFFNAIDGDKKDIELVLRVSKHESEEFYSLSDIENSKHKEDCDCDKKISKKIFFKVIKPILDEMLKKTDYQVKAKVVDQK